jgi:tetratricopeptide (TPR) repeat protein
MLTKSNPGGLEPKRDPSPSSEPESQNDLWVNAHLKVVEANATKWFEDLDPKTVSELFPKQLEAHKDVHGYSAYFGGQEAGATIPGMEINLDELGEPDVIENTEIGRAVIAELRSRGVNFRFADSIPINHFQSIVLEVGDELLGQWGTELGTPFQHHFKVFKNEAGEETGLWFVQLLASPLPLSSANEYEIQEDGVRQTLSVPDEQLAQGLFCFGEISTKIHLPILLKKIAYLAETPLPNSQLMSFSRDLAFKEIPKDARPIPTYSILKDKAFLSFAHGDEEAGEPDSFKGQIVPEMVIFGWRFGKESLAHVSSFIPTIVDGCTLAVSTIEWGYNYHRKQDTRVDYDFSLSNPCKNYLDYVRGGSRLARPQWIPVTQLGDIITMCEKTLQNAQSQLYSEGGLAWAELKKVVNDGVGWYIASAINKLEWLWYIPLLVNDPEALPDSEYFLKQAISLNVQNESTQALIYLGLAKMMVGDYESAQKILRGALDRPDKFGTAEIHYYRSLIYAKQKNRSSQMLLRSYVKQLGGFLAPAYIEEALNISESNAPGFESARPQNCGACGTQFESEAVNFCGSCGTGREEVSVSGEGSIGQGYLSVGFILEISSINEELDQPMASETLTDFTNESLVESGYGKIWRAALGQKALVDEQDFTSTVWVDPTSFFSYLSALCGTVYGEFIAFSFDSEPNPTDFNSASWGIIRKRLRTSVVHDFLLKEHRVDFESSGQSFYLEEFVVEGVNRLSLEKLEGAVKDLRIAAPNSKSAKQFLEFFDPELQRIAFLPSFISGHLWAHILSGCNWSLASQILEAKGSLSFDADSFAWEPPAEDMQSYSGGYAIEWYRNLRRSINFNPWPWRAGSIDQNGEPDSRGLFRDQVAQLLGDRPPVAHEKVSAFGALYLLVDHEDDDDDDAPSTQDRERTLIEDYMSDSLRDFITENLELIKACFGALQEVLTDLGDGENWLPVWSGSEGFLAGVPPAYSKTENAEEIEFETSLIESVEKLWPEFISITSQKQA